MPKPGVLRTLGGIHKDSSSLPTGFWIQEANPESPGPHYTVRDQEGAKRGQLRDSPGTCALTREKGSNCWVPRKPHILCNLAPKTSAPGRKYLWCRSTVDGARPSVWQTCSHVWTPGFPQWSSHYDLGPAQGLIHKSHSRSLSWPNPLNQGSTVLAIIKFSSCSSQCMDSKGRLHGSYPERPIL